jgi:4-hydroxybenzoate polyprenyltransferase/phosphoserine phosphatase
MNKSMLPLVVDLDGTLIKTDLLVETASQFLLVQPWNAFKLLRWLLQGKSVLKTQLAVNTHVDATVLPYNAELIIYLKQQKAQGRRIVLATASHRLLAEQVAAHLNLFDDVLASDVSTNLKSGKKCAALVDMFGEHGFDYVGNDLADMAVWQSANQSHVVACGRQPSRLIESVRKQGKLGQVFGDGKTAVVYALLKAMRPHQWMKNLLVFIPLLAAHRYGVASSVYPALLAFFVFSLTASSVYLLNDMVDVVDDRHHARKCQRPFAAGHLSLLQGWMAWPLLLIGAFTLAIVMLPWLFTISLGTYFVLTLVYSLRLKQIPIIDVLALAGLYTLRIIAGAVAIAVPLTFWLLSFSMFLFLSLAFIKRYSELKAARTGGQSSALRGRGYSPSDLEVVADLGGCAGYTGVLVLALYIQDSHTVSLYATPQFIWLACPLLLYWISRAWLITHRGQMHDDPIVFAMKDRVSWLCMALFATMFLLAGQGGVA